MNWINSPQREENGLYDICTFNFCVQRDDPSCSENGNTCGIKFCWTRYCLSKDGCIKFL